MSRLGVTAVILVGLGAGAVLGQMYGRTSFSAIDDAIACAVIADAIEVGAISNDGSVQAIATLAQSTALDDKQKSAVRRSEACVTRAMNKKHGPSNGGGK